MLGTKHQGTAPTPNLPGCLCRICTLQNHSVLLLQPGGSSFLFLHNTRPRRGGTGRQRELNGNGNSTGEGVDNFSRSVLPRQEPGTRGGGHG